MSPGIIPGIRPKHVTDADSARNNVTSDACCPTEVRYTVDMAEPTGPDTMVFVWVNKIEPAPPAAPIRASGDYAQNYTKQDAPIQVSDGVLDTEAYGVKSTSADMLRFIDANLQTGLTDAAMQRALLPSMRRCHLRQRAGSTRPDRRTGLPRMWRLSRLRRSGL